MVHGVSGGGLIGVGKAAGASTVTAKVQQRGGGEEANEKNDSKAEESAENGKAGKINVVA